MTNMRKLGVCAVLAAVLSSGCGAAEEGGEELGGEELGSTQQALSTWQPIAGMNASMYGGTLVQRLGPMFWALTVPFDLSPRSNAWIGSNNNSNTWAGWVGLGGGSSGSKVAAVSWRGSLGVNEQRNVAVAYYQNGAMRFGWSRYNDTFFNSTSWQSLNPPAGVGFSSANPALAYAGTTAGGGFIYLLVKDGMNQVWAKRHAVTSSGFSPSVGSPTNWSNWVAVGAADVSGGVAAAGVSVNRIVLASTRHTAAMNDTSCRLLTINTTGAGTVGTVGAWTSLPAASCGWQPTSTPGIGPISDGNSGARIVAFGTDVKLWQASLGFNGTSTVAGPWTQVLQTGCTQPTSNPGVTEHSLGVVVTTTCSGSPELKWLTL